MKKITDNQPKLSDAKLGGDSKISTSPTELSDDQLSIAAGGHKACVSGEHIKKATIKI